MKSTVGLLLVLGMVTFIFPVRPFASDIIYCGALNSRVILLHFDDGYVRYHKKGEARDNEWVVQEPLDLNKASNQLNFKIKSKVGFYAEPKNPVKIERKTKGTEFTWLCSSWSQSVGCVNSQPDHAKEHWLYLYLPEPLTQGQKYTILTDDVAGNGKSNEFVFSPDQNRSEAVHVNLVGYDPAAPRKYGYVYHWGGSSGSVDFSEYTGNNFYLIDYQTMEKVFTGEVVFRKSKTNIETRQTNDTPNQNFLGADVWECDFSDFNVPGEYILAVDGVGHSFPFKIKPDVLRHAFYNSIRGLYHNRSGIALDEAYTEFTRPAPHNPEETPGFAGKLHYTTSRFIDWNDLNASSSDLDAIENGILGPINTWGWYQDAGDWDGYFTHLKIPALLMLTWEIAPKKFSDGELNIPGSGNGIPDILDEASWLIRFFYRTRHEIMDSGYGTGGVGSRVAPDWYGHAPEGTPSYEDTGKWVISGEDPFTTFFYAGLAGHYAAILNQLEIEDPDGIDWQKEAEEAYNWALNNTKPTDTNPTNVHDFNLSDFQFYAAVSLFRLTGDENYAQTIEENSSAIGKSTILNEDQKWGTYALLTGNEYEFPNQVLIESLKGAVIATADQKNNSVEQRACRYGGNIWLPMLIGQGTTPRVFEMMMGHFISKEAAPAKADEYITNLYTTADYFLGCNPLNMTWITHVGVRYPERVLHIDSWYNRRDEMVPGITPYGPWKDDNASQIGPWSLQWPYKTLYPEGIENWPGHERWFNNYTTPANAEFTVHQNTVLSAVVYGYLCDEPDGSYEPNKHPSVQLSTAKDSMVWEKSIFLSADASDPNGDDDIAWVEFYNDWHKIGQSNKPPYSFDWKMPKYGEAKLSAKVVDKSGYSSKSEEITLTIIPAAHQISIEVKDSITGSVIPGTKIEIDGQVEMTGETGFASFEEVNGQFSLNIEHEGYDVFSASEIVVYSDTTLTFFLNPIEKSVTLVVHDSQTADVFPGTSVLFNSELQVTNDNGEVFFSAYNGEYNYSVGKSSFREEQGTITIESDTTIHLFLVRTEAEIKIEIKEGTTPVNDVNVVLNSDTIASTALGIARFKNLSVNEQYRYYLHKPGFYDVSDSLYLTTDTVISISLTRIPTGTKNMFNHSDLTIWPNPADDELTIKSPEKIGSIEVFTASGNRMAVIKPEEQPGEIKMNISHLARGIYFLKIRFDDERFVVRKVEKY